MYVQPVVKPLEYIVLSIILAISILIGVYYGFKDRIHALFSCKKKIIKNGKVEAVEMSSRGDGEEEDAKLTEYLTAKSSMGILPVTFSLMASVFSATGLVGAPTEVYQYGLDYWIVGWGFATPPILGAFVFGPFFTRLNINSVFEYLEMRYDSRAVKTIANICYLLRTLLAAGFITYGPATAVSLILDLDQNITIGLIGIIGTFYTAIGGMKAVIWTDLFQALIMLSSVAMIAIKGIVDAGGFDQFWQRNEQGGRLRLFDFNPDPFIRQSFWSYYFGAAIFFSMNYCFDQQMIQRFKAAKTKRQAQISLLLNTPIVILFVSCCCLIGLSIYANYSDCDPFESGRIKNNNQYSSFFVLNNLNDVPTGIGIFLGALFCSSLSSLASSLNAMTYIIWEDFLMLLGYFKKFDENKKLNINKFIVVLNGIASTGLCYILSLININLAQLNNSLLGTLNAPLIGLFIMSMFFSVSNRLGAIIGTSIGLVINLSLSIGAIVINPVSPRLNVSVEACFNETSLIGTNASYIISYKDRETNLTGFEKVFGLAFFWYTSFGALVTIISGLFVSLITGGLKSCASVDESLFVYDLTKFLRKRK